MTTTQTSLIGQSILSQSSGIEVPLPFPLPGSVTVHLPTYVLPHKFSDTPTTLSVQDYNRAVGLFQQGDRAGAYLVLAEGTGNPAFLNTAQISSGSGCLVGGPAIAANAALQQRFSEIYPNYSIEQFSNVVLTMELGGFTAVRNGAGEITHYAGPSEAQAYQNARNAWLYAKGEPDERLAQLFPGNFFLAGDAYLRGDAVSGDYYWAGTQVGILAESFATEYFGVGVQYGITYGQAMELTRTSGTRSVDVIQGQRMYSFVTAEGKRYVFRDADLQMCVFDVTPGIGIPTKPLPPRGVRISDLGELSDAQLVGLIQGLTADDPSAISAGTLATIARSQMAGRDGEATLVLNDDKTLVLSANGMQATIDVVDGAWTRISARADGDLDYADSTGATLVQGLPDDVLLAPLTYAQGLADASDTQTPVQNLVNLTTTTTGTASTNAVEGVNDAVNSNNSTLIFNADYRLFGFGDVNGASGAVAIGNYAAADGLRVGAGNIGLNIDESTGLGLKPPPAGSDTSLYSLFGAQTNSASESNTELEPADPLVLDLNGDGVRLTSYGQSPVLFDIDNDGGSLEQTGWVSAQDGIVVHDLNGDGSINSIRETLSEYYNGVAGSGGQAGTKPHANGFAALKSLDSNNDNQFTSADSAWGNLRVWVDANHDGKTDTGELKTFLQLGITSINLAVTTQSGEVLDGNEVLARGTFVQSGVTRQAVSANFLANPAGSTVTQVAGGVRISTGDAGGAIVSHVSQNTNAGLSETLDAAALGARHITGGAGNDTVTGDAQNNWLIGSGGADTLSGGGGDDVLLFDAGDRIDGGAGMDVGQVVGSGGVLLDLARSNIEIAVGGDGNDTLIGGGRSTVFVRGGAGDDIIVGGAANDVLSGEDGDDLADGGAGNDMLRGHRGADQLVGGAGDDVLDGGTEDDVLSAGAGNDVLIGGRGDDVLDGGDGVDVAQYSGSYGDYRITRIVDGSGRTSYRVVDVRGGQDGADTLTGIEKLSFADVSQMELSVGVPQAVKDILTVNSSGAALSRTGAHLISRNQLLANDRDFDSDITQLVITDVLNARGGTVTLTAQGDVLFTPNASYTGVMSFQYRVRDAQNNQSTVTVGGQTEVLKAAVYLQTPDVPTDPLAMDQWYLSDVNIIPVWKDYTGKGVRIGQFEPGTIYSTGPEVFDYRHPDLQPNVDKAWLNEVVSDPAKAVTQTFNQHATMVAGVMVAARNGEGGVGVAYDATLAGNHFVGTGLELNQLAEQVRQALAQFRNYDVVNNSWSPTVDFFVRTDPPDVMDNGMRDAVLYGRGGLGTAMVMAAGNDRAKGSNTNYNALTANHAVITVGAINAGTGDGAFPSGVKPFSNPGASILVSAPGSNISTTSRELISDDGSTFGTDYDAAQGTSLAAPIVSGVIALMLEANSELGYRDIQTILAMSATRVDDPNGTDWTYNTARVWNGGGMHTSHDYGFGKVDARAAVRLAETWQGQAHAYNLDGRTGTSAALNAAIPDGAGVYSTTLAMGAGIEVESAQVTVNLDHARWGDLIIKLISPTGTTSVLVDRPGKAPGSGASDLGYGAYGNMNLSFNTTHVRGEASGGTWTLQVIDAATGATGTVNNWKLELYGAVADSDDVYVYTNEFASFAGAARGTLTDTNGGNDTINASAVTGNSTINLNNGSTSTIAGKNLTLGGDIEYAFGGDGNDVLTGNASHNVLDGGRGNDTIAGGVGSELIFGGRGNDSLTGGADRDYFIFRPEANSTDTITDFNPSEAGEKILLVGFPGIADYTQLVITQEGANLRVGLGAGQSILLLNVAQSQLSEQNFTFLVDGVALNEYFRYAALPMYEGTAGDENWIFSPGPVSSFLLGGNDSVASEGADDLLDGGNGDDWLWGDYGAVSGADWLEGGAGNDMLQGEAGNDRLVGGSGTDEMYGEDGDDLMFGGSGDDYLDGGAGNDILVLEGDWGGYDATSANWFGNRLGGAGADMFTLLANGGGTNGGSGYVVATGVFQAQNVIADFEVAGGDRIDLRFHPAISSITDLTIENLPDAPVPTVRVSAGGTQPFSVYLRGVTASQLHSGHFIFAASIPGLVKGTAGADVLTGDAGANTMDGRGGADAMTGRTGDDTYIVDNAGDQVNELPGGGYDTVQSSVSYTLSADVEALTLTGTGNLAATGNAQRNRLRGNSGNNRLDGGAEADEMLGGAGNDTYVADSQLDAITEKAGEGTDTVEASVSWTLGTHVENLVLTGASHINGTGNAAANSLAGNAGDNVLDGAEGADTMAGGAGSDTYYVDNAGDVVVEAANAGTDNVWASVNLTLAANVEGGFLFGAATSLAGNALNNTLVGNGLANTLTGGGGNDVLHGGGGADSLLGGTGDDTYYVDAADAITENVAEGQDTVVADFTYTLGANLESLVLAGDAAISGTGNALDNRLLGNAAANTLTGAGGNDVLDGGAGADTLAGGSGDDTYIVEDLQDSIVETVGNGTDTVLATVSYSLASLAHVENLTLAGSDAIQAVGNDAANVLTGSWAANVLTGAAGNDTLRGGQGADALFGGTGNDTYRFAGGDGHDVITENDATAGNVDTIAFDPGIVPGSVAVSRAGMDLKLSLSPGDSITVKDWFASAAAKVEQVSFADGTTWSATQLRTLSNLAPVATTTIAPQAATEDLPFSYTAPAGLFSDQDQAIGDTLSYSARLAGGAALPAWLQFNAGTRTFSGTPANGDVAALTVELVATDDVGGTGSITFALTVANVNDAPALTGTQTTLASGQEDGGYTIHKTDLLAGFTDVDGDALEVANLTAGNGTLSAFNAASGTWTFTPAANYFGPVTLAYSVVDGHGGSVAASRSFTLANVNDAPTGGLAVSGTTTQGQTLTATSTLADVDGMGSLSFQWQASADGSTWSNISGANASSLVLTAGLVGLQVRAAATYTDGGGTMEVVASAATSAVSSSNLAPTGSVSVTGTATQGQTLTASNDLADPDGLGPIAYQWQSSIDGISWTSIAGATNAAFTLGQAQVGRRVRAIASYTDGGGTTENIASAMSTPVANVNDAPTGAVSVSGSATQGQVLTASNTLADADGLGAIAYQWQSSADGTSWSNIAGATGATFTLGQAQVGQRVRVTAGYTDGGGTAESMASAMSAVVANANDAPTGAVMVAGTASQGQTLTVSNTLADVDGLGTVGYQWQASADGTTWSNIAGATGTSLALGQAQVGLRVRALASYTDGMGTAESVASVASAPVANVNDAPTGGVTVAGTAAQGQTLTASHTLSDIDGLGTVGYQWQSSVDGTSWSNIAGATAASFMLTQAQVGRRVRALAGYTDGGGTAETVASAATAVVGNVNDAPTGGLVITGTATQGQTLGVASTLADADGLGLLTYQWQSSADGTNWSNIAGATAASLVLGQSHVGLRLRAVGSYTDGGGTVESVASTATGLVANVNDAPTGNVTVNGTPRQNETLTATHTLADADGLGAISYRWQSSSNGSTWSDIAGATGASFTVTAAQIGLQVRAAASYVDAQGTAETAYSAAALVELAYHGTPGPDTMTGTSGADTMHGHAGDDVYTVNHAGDVVVEAAGEGTDTVNASVSYTLAANVENLTLTGSAAINGTANALNNVLTGNGGTNVMTGGAGDDTYVVGIGDYTIENAGEGLDTVVTDFTHYLGANVENLTLTGTANINGTGNELDNLLIGNAGANYLVGGAGNDTYIVGEGDLVVEGNVIPFEGVAVDFGGLDTVLSSATITLGYFVENLILTGTAAINGTGNFSLNLMQGNTANNVLSGGPNSTTYVQFRGGAADTIVESSINFPMSTDVLRFLSSVAADQLWFRQSGNNLEVSIIGTSDKVTVRDWYLGAQYQVEQIRTDDGNRMLLASNVQNLVNAMAAFAPPAAGQTTLPANYAASLNPVIAANWQ